MERKYKVNTYQVAYVCPKCNSGDMELLYQYNPNASYYNYMHKCNNKSCDNMLSLPTIYPKIEYEEVKTKTGDQSWKRKLELKTTSVAKRKDSVKKKN